MKRTPGTAPAASSTRRVARQVWRGLIQVLAAPDAAPAWWRPPWPRRVYLALGVTTLALGVVSLDSIAVRAETAPYRIAGLPEPAQAEFSSLSEVAREALTEMRRLLGLLRHDQPADLAPQPELADLPSLVDTARQAGLSVELSVPPALDHVPSGVGLCAYRIVQESLSNAGRHAPGAAVTVSVEHGSGAVLLRVANGPGGPAGRPGTSTGLVTG